VLASLCRRPKMISKLQSILHKIGAVAYSWDHEVKLQKKRMKSVKPESRLLKGPNIWNVAVIDNIDFKDITFHHGNIYDATRNSAHATLRMVFQFQLPLPVTTYLQNYQEDTSKLELFGRSTYTNEWESTTHEIFQNLLHTYENDFDLQDIYEMLTSKVKLGCKVPPPNVVILKAGPAPKDDNSVFESINMYLEEL